MIAIISLFIVLILSLITTRIATVALTLTGLSEETAKFQARSAFTGCGYTTQESEQVVNHPVRRRIITILMLLGNAGIVTSVSSLILAFVQTTEIRSWVIRIVIIVAGVMLLWLISASRWITRQMERVIKLALQKWTDVEVRDYVSLLRLSDDFSVAEIKVEPNDWLVDKTLAELDLHKEGVTVLGIQLADGTYIGVPTGSTQIHAGDVLLLYGRAQTIEDLDKRRFGIEGDIAHKKAVNAERHRMIEQKRAERKREEAEEHKKG